MEFLEKLMGGPLTLNGAISAIRESEGESLSQFSERLGISRTHLSDIEHGQAISQPGASSSIRGGPGL